MNTTEAEILADLESFACRKLVPPWWKLWRRKERKALLDAIGRGSVMKSVAAASVRTFLADVHKGIKS